MTEAERQMKDALTLLHMAFIAVCEAADVDIEGSEITLRARHAGERKYRLSEVLELSAAAAALAN